MLHFAARLKFQAAPLSGKVDRNCKKYKSTNDEDGVRANCDPHLILNTEVVSSWSLGESGGKSRWSGCSVHRSEFHSISIFCIRVLARFRVHDGTILPSNIYQHMTAVRTVELPREDASASSFFNAVSPGN
jgi:hypothetical protein